MKLRDLLILASSVAATSQVSALSLGSSQGNVQLGNPVDLVFQIKADHGETAQSSCASADIWMGDTILGSSQVLVAAQDHAVRVRTTAPVFEPLITVKISAGCTNTISRSYTFFADPPAALAASVVPIDLSKIQRQAPIATSTHVTPRPPSIKVARPSKRIVNRAAARQIAAAAIAEPASEDTQPNISAHQISELPDSSKTTAPATDNSKPRLQMESLEGFDPTPSANSVAPPIPAIADTPTLSVESGTAPLGDMNTARLEAMEQQLQALQQQLTSNHTEISGLQSQLAKAQNPDLPIWVHVMLGLLALALATIAWLLQRLRLSRQNAHPTWAHTVLAAEDPSLAPKPVADTSIQAHAFEQAPPVVQAPQMKNAEDNTSAAPVRSTPAPPTPAKLPQVLAKTAAAKISDVLTTQALFDVQEQAEFYASIGENDHAIEILQSHIALHETSSPLAYIELLQLLYRLSRTQMFEQVRIRFQEHFNVNAATFMEFADKGHHLAGGYPTVLSQVEALWNSDQAQTLLRSLIVRSTSAQNQNSEGRFDLAAFEELLKLYNVAKTTPGTSNGPFPAQLLSSHAPSSAPETAPVAMASALPFSATELSLDLDLLSAAPSTTNLASAVPASDSPFQTTDHFASDEALMADLSLEWESVVLTEAHPAPASIDALNAELSALKLDALDLSTSEQPPKRI